MSTFLRSLLFFRFPCKLTHNHKQRHMFMVQKRFQSEYKRKNNHGIINVKFCEKDRLVILNSDLDNSNNKYPSLWLRDNCQCNQCFHIGTKSRTVNWEKFDININLNEISFDQSKNELNILWSDYHKSVYKYDWLKERDFSGKSQEQYLEEFYRAKKKLWNRESFTKILQTFQFNDIIESDQALNDWLVCLSIYGVAIIKNAKLTENQCRNIANRVGFIKRTHYGEEFIVVSKEGTSNVAYISTPLQLHTDLPYYEYKPGVNLLHCLVQSLSNGGDNLLADAFYAAEKMRSNEPEMFKILSTTLVNWSDLGQENGNNFHSIYRSPVFEIGSNGYLKRINHSVPQRDSFFSIPMEEVNSWYQAMSYFVKLIHEEAVSFKTKPGDILTFDNIRLVHGRTGYKDEDNGNNTRYLVGVYLDWDEIYSKLRVLKTTLKKNTLKI